ncbi:hypothetical protein Tco_0176507, partial [Tanacetum coccineum]
GTDSNDSDNHPNMENVCGHNLCGLKAYHQIEEGSTSLYGNKVKETSKPISISDSADSQIGFKMNGKERDIQSILANGEHNVYQ